MGILVFPIYHVHFGPQRAIGSGYVLATASSALIAIDLGISKRSNIPISTFNDDVLCPAFGLR